MVSWPLVGAGTGLGVMVVGIILGFAVFPPLVEDKIHEVSLFLSNT